jgi:hypothetical protein
MACTSTICSFYSVRSCITIRSFIFPYAVSKFGGGLRPQNGPVSPTFHKRNHPGVETERSRPSVITNIYKPCGDSGSLVWGGNQGLLPMTISEEESNLFCACHLLNCDEDQGQWSITGFWYIVNGARHTEKKRNKPVGDRDHEVLGMRSFGEYTQQIIRELSRAYHQLQRLNTELVYFGIKQFQLKKRKWLILKYTSKINYT